MHSTIKNISNEAIKTNSDTVTNRYINYTKHKERKAEGGLRLKNKYKHSIENQPLVTIITVVYNNEELLERCILSVFNQTYENIEYIIIDGASTDNTLEIIKKYEDYIDYYISEPDGGIYYAMNKGLELASGDYIVMLNSDDYYYDFAVNNSIKALLKENAQISGAIADIISYEGDFLHKSRLNNFDDTAFLMGIPVCHQTIFIDKKLYNKVGYYDTNFKIASDLDLIFKIIDLEAKYVLLNYSIVAFTNNGTSSDLKAMYNENAVMLSKRLPNDMSLKEVDTFHKFASGYVGTSYKYDDINKFILRDNFTKNQKQLIYRRAMEIKPKIANDIFHKNEYSTIKNISNEAIKINSDTVTNRYINYPKHEDRKAEGGLRLKNKYKHSIENQPLITIITVVYNNEELLERCILSVLNQTYKNIEYIIIDGGSTDNTIEIIKKYEDYIDYYISEPDNGLYYAMNKGLELASGDYIVMLNSDDFYFMDAMKISMDKISKERTYASMASFNFIDKDSNIISIIKPYPVSSLYIFHYSVAGHETFVVHKDCYQKIGLYDTEFKIASDFKFKCLIFKTFKVSIIMNAILNHKNDGVSSKPCNKEICLGEVYKIIMKMTNIYGEEDIKKLVFLVSENSIFDNFEDTINKMRTKYDFNDDLYKCLFNLYSPMERPKGERKLTLLEHIFSVYTKRHFIEIRLLGFRIALKRKRIKK